MVEVNKQRVLICHHVEPMWEEGLLNHGVNPDILVEKLIKHIQTNDYHRIILVRFECDRWDSYTGRYEGWYELAEVLTGGQHYLEIQIYGFGWQLEEFADQMEYDEPTMDDLPCEVKYGDWITEGGSHSEVVLVPEWMRELSQYKLNICGAFDGQCVEDLEIALDFLEIKYKRLEDLIV